MMSQSVDPIERLLSEENINRLNKLVDMLPTLEKVVDLVKELDSSGKLDNILNLTKEGLDLLDAVQRAQLVDTLVEFGLDQISKVQALWPLVEKITSDRALNLLQKLDIDSLLNATEKLIPILNKLTDEKTLKLLDQMDLDSMLNALNTLMPVMKKLTSPEAVKAVSSLDVDSMLKLLDRLVELQKTGALDKTLDLLNTLADPATIDALKLVTDKMLKAVKMWVADLPKVQPVGTFGLLGKLSDKNTQYALGALLKLAEDLGKVLRE